MTSYSAAWSSYYDAYSSYAADYSAAWSSYGVALSSYYAGGGGYEYQYYYTTYYYYIIIWYTVNIQRQEITSSSRSTSTVLSAYCTNTAEAQLSFSSMAQSVDSAVSYSAVASSRALSSFPSATASYSLMAGGGSSSSAAVGSGNGAGSMGSARHGALAVVLPVLGLMTGLFAVLL